MYLSSSFLYETGLVVIYCYFQRLSLQTLTEKRSIHLLLSTEYIYTNIYIHILPLTQPDSLVLLVGHKLFSGIPTLPYVYIFRG